MLWLHSTPSKKELEKAAFHHIHESLLFVEECDASESTMFATLHQAGQPVAFTTRMLHGRELHCFAVAKEAISNGNRGISTEVAALPCSSPFCP